MILDEKKLHMGPEKPKKVKKPRSRHYKTLLMITPVLLVLGVVLVSYGPFGGEEMAPDFTLKDVRDGEMVTLSDQLGKAVLIDFFSTTCNDCNWYHITLQEIRNEYSTSNLTMISISIAEAQDTEDGLRAYANETGINWSIALDSGTVAKDYNIEVIPTTIIVDTRGAIVFEESGVLSNLTLSGEINSILGR